MFFFFICDVFWILLQLVKFTFDQFILTEGFLLDLT